MSQPMATSSILLFGATSVLGFHLARLYPDIVVPFIPPGNPSLAVRSWPILQLEKPKWIDELFYRYQPQTLLYCHAVCDVPKCEADPDWAYEINVEHVKRVLAALPPRTKLVYISSDHVFGGDGTYFEESTPCPISVYGRTRAEAERLVLCRPKSLVIRVGLAIGSSPNGRTGHLDWLRYRTRRNLPITIVEDEYRSVVWAKDAAFRVLSLADSDEVGIHHLSSTRAVSRVRLANYLMRLLGETPSFTVERRRDRPVPHLGRVELFSSHCEFPPLASVIDEVHEGGFKNSSGMSASFWSDAFVPI